MKTIRQLREEKGLTQLQLAVELGVTPSTIYTWESGRSELKVRQLRKLAELFGVSMDVIALEEAEGKAAA